MLQVLQNLNTGETNVVDVPTPAPKDGHVLIQTSRSLISMGTERMLVDFSKANLLAKAKLQPDKVKMVFERLQTDGLIATYDSVKSKLDEPMPLGYCNVGSIITTSKSETSKPKRVVSNGYHAEIVRVPNNLTALIPDNVDDETASFTVLASIALQGIRLINPTIGESVVVTGLGVIGLLAVQILIANGCRVLGIDHDHNRCMLAKRFGAEIVDLSKGDDPLIAASKFSKGYGVDAVLIAASSKNHDIVHEAASMSRKRGRIVLVGVVGLNLNRQDFYEKELSFQVSCSYGPGRYDSNYEDKGQDYPFGFVRWTEKRNFETILNLMSAGLINVKPLISKTFGIQDAPLAYRELANPSVLGVMLSYPSADYQSLQSQTLSLKKSSKSHKSDTGSVSFIGGGNYASRVLLPAFKKSQANLSCIVTSSGTSAEIYGKKFGFLRASTDINEAFTKETDAVVIATRHNLHASQILEALTHNKHVFVEKPLALNIDDVNLIQQAHETSNTILMVGFNRRFSPLTRKMKELLQTKAAPKSFIMTMNAGNIPFDHWAQDPEIGGGRIIGEACHYIDLMRYLAGSKITNYSASRIDFNDANKVSEDKAIITLNFEDGSVGSINYFANGSNSFPKERIEVFCDNSVLQLNNFLSLKAYGFKGFRTMKLWYQDKGQNNCVKLFMDSIRTGKNSPIPIDQILEVATVSIEIANLLRR